jgi:hypothetical protein
MNKKQYLLKFLGLSLAVLALAAFAPSASAGVGGTLNTGSSGTVTVTMNSITWDHDPGSISSGTWNGEVANGTNLTFQGCTGGLGSPGCLVNGGGIAINHLAPLVNGVTSLPIDGFLTFAGVPALNFTLTGIFPGSSNTNCSGLLVGDSCSVFAGSPIILTLSATNRTQVVMSMFGTATDGSGVLSNWTGGFSATLPNTTPAQIAASFAADRNASISASNSGSFSATPVPITPPPPPPPGNIKVTGGGQIQVPNVNSPGTATFGFNAGTGNGGHFNYVNHVNGLHVDGPVNDIVVIAFNPDGSPKTVLFSGTCGQGCSFSVTVEDHGEPGTSDQFGVTVTGSISEFRSQRVISGGNIQFHK